MILQASKLAQVRGSRLELTKSGHEALSHFAGEVLKRAWKAWIGSDLLEEMNRIDAIRGQTGSGKRGMTDLSDRRAAISDALLHHQPEKTAFCQPEKAGYA